MGYTLERGKERERKIKGERIRGSVRMRKREKMRKE